MDPLILILKRLRDNGVDFVLIGGMAAVAHGSPIVTHDVDVCVTFDPVNLPKIVDALWPIHPRIRTRPDKMPLPGIDKLPPDLKNLYLMTDLGQIDLLGELPEVCSFAELQGRTVELDVGGVLCRVLDLDTLIQCKKIAARDKDRQTLMYLEAVRKARQNRKE